MKKLFYTLTLLLGGSAAMATPGDTTWVQAQNALQLDHYGAFDIPVAFPSGNTTFRKIYMTFTLGTYDPCPPPSNPNDPYYCHQWDYDVHNVLMTPGGDTMELGRFITPYANTGVWRFPSGWTHSYIFDVTDYAPLLKGNNTFRIFYSGYSWGFTADVKFAFVEGTPERTVMGVSKLWGGSWEYGNAVNPISNHLTTQTRTAPSGTQSADMKVLVTGHGSDVNYCCEFASHNYMAKVNGSTVATVPVWRADCGWNDIYPQGGTWIYDRANWCPGLEVQQKVHPLTGVTGGSTYTADMVFDPYTASSNYGSYNIQANAIYYGGMNKTLDASLEAIYEPNSYDGYYRSNPSEGKPRIKVRNTGSSAITSMQVVYGVKDSMMSTYSWTGNIPSLEEDTIELPYLPTLENMSLGAVSGTHTFIAQIAAVNGAADADATNDTMRSTFKVAPKWPTKIVVAMRTNNEGVNGLNQGPSENSWEIRNSAGTLIASRTNAALSTTYRDTVEFATTGLYTLRVMDGGCDGLNWWVYNANPQIGVTAGSFSVTRTNNFPIALNGTSNGGSYGADFGCGFTEAFSVVGTTPVGVSNVLESTKSLAVFPNPAHDQMTVSLEGFAKVEGVLEITDITGRAVQTQHVNASTVQIATASFAPGLYQVRFTAADGGQWQQRVTVVR